MMPLIYAREDEEKIIKRVGGNAEARRHLENLGFVCGASVSVLATMGGNLIVSIKGSRVAVSREAASKIMV